MSNVYNRSKAESPGLSDAGIGDWLLWSLKSRATILGTGFVATKGANVLDPVKFGAYFRLVQDPEAATERDVYTVMFSDRSSTTQGPRVNFVTSTHAPELGRVFVDDHRMFNPRYRGMTMQEARMAWERSPIPEFFNIDYHTPTRRIRRDQLRGWQIECAKWFDRPEDALFGRIMYWLWDSGKTGKSIMLKYLSGLTFGLVLAVTNGADCLYTVKCFFERHGRGPSVIVANIPRSANMDLIEYDLLEKVKDGSFVSTKYHSGAVEMDCPHIIIFANHPPDESKLTADRWRIINTADIVVAPDTDTSDDSADSVPSPPEFPAPSASTPVAMDLEEEVVIEVVNDSSDDELDGDAADDHSESDSIAHAVQDSDDQCSLDGDAVDVYSF
jgi:hypothetical protein